MTNQSIALNQLISFAQSAYFFHALQNYQYLPYSVEGGVFGIFQGDGGQFRSGEINDVLAGTYKGRGTFPQLNLGEGGTSGQSMPLSIFKDLNGNLINGQSYAYESSAGIQRYLNFFINEFAERPRGYPEGISPPDSNGAVFLSDGALKMYRLYPYISVNELDKVDNWLNITDPANHSATDTNPVGKTNDNKGAQFAIFNERMPDEGSLNFNNDDLQVADAKLKSTRQFKPGGGARYEFPFLPSASGTPLTFSITYETTDTITKESTSGSSGSWSETTTVSLGFKQTASATATVPISTGGTSSATVSSETTQNFTQALQASGAWNQALKEGRSTINKGTLKVDFSPSNFKPGSKLSSVITPPSGVQLANPNDILEEGGTYIAEFIVSKSNISAPASGLTTISGTPGVIAPRSMQYQSAGKDKGRANWSIDGTKPGGILEGRNAAFWGEKFLQGGGILAYGLEDAKIINNNGDIVDQKAVTFDSNRGTTTILNLARMSAELNYDVKLKVSRVHEASVASGANALMALNSTSAIDLDDIGQDNMADFYKGNADSDFIDGSNEGGDSAETGGGNDQLTNFTDSYLDSGDGNDVISLQQGYSNNTIYLGEGSDEADIASSGNFVNLGTGQDTIRIFNLGNTIDLGRDNDQDLVTYTDDSFQADDDLSVENFDLGRDVVTGFSSTKIEYAYDSLHRMITGTQLNQAGAQSSAQFWIHPDEDLNINRNDHRLFLQLLSSSDLTAADRVFIETESLSEAQWDAFIERFVFSDQPLNAADAQSNAFMTADLKQLLNNPDLQSLGRAIWEAASSAGESALKTLITTKLVDLGIPEAAATDVVNSSWAIVVGLLEQSVTDANAMAIPSDSAFSAAADTFLIELSSRMEENFHAKAFPTEQIDPLTGLAITPSADDNTITGTDSKDWIRAGSGDDQIDSGAGNDAVRAGTGSDRISLGAGADALIISYDQMDGATDTLTDFNAAEDRLLLEDGIQIEQLSGDRFRLFTNGNLGEEERELTLLLESGGADLATLNIERFSFG